MISKGNCLASCIPVGKHQKTKVAKYPFLFLAPVRCSGPTASTEHTTRFWVKCLWERIAGGSFSVTVRWEELYNCKVYPGHRIRLLGFLLQGCVLEMAVFEMAARSRAHWKGDQDARESGGRSWLSFSMNHLKHLSPSVAAGPGEVWFIVETPCFVVLCFLQN